MRTLVSNNLSVITEVDRDIWILLLTRALRSFSAAILSVSFAIYLSKLGADSVHIGLVFTGIALFSSIRSLFEGIIADRLGRKPVLLFTSILMTIGGLIFVLTNELNILMVSAVIFCVGGRLPYTPAEQAILTDKVSSESRTMAFSVNSFLEAMMAVFGSLAAVIPEVLQHRGISEIASYRPVFLIFASAGLISTLFFSMIKETIQMKDVEDVVENEKITLYERRLLIRWSAVLALDIIGGSFIMSLLPYWFYIKFGVGLGQIGTLFGASRLIAAGSYYLGLMMAKRVGTIRATALSRIPVIIINYLTPIVPVYSITAYLRGFMSLFSDIDIPLRQSYLMGVIKNGRRASAAGFIAMVSRLTSACAPLLSGYIIQHISINLPFYIAASFQLVSAGLMYYFFKDIRPPEEE